jgi:hypothetical protein
MQIPKLQFKNVKDLPVKVTDWIGSSWSLVLHTLFFAGMFALYLLDYDFDDILLILTTLVSLEAIYLSIFIQMTVNRNTQSLQEVEEDLGAMEKDIDEIQEDIQEDDVVDTQTTKALATIETKLQALIQEIENIRHQQK